MMKGRSARVANLKTMALRRSNDSGEVEVTIWLYKAPKCIFSRARTEIKVRLFSQGGEKVRVNTRR
jgi:hypothetical protein